MEIIQILSIVVSIAVLTLVLEAIRRRLLKERYALLWLFASGVLLIFSFWRQGLDVVAHVFGFYYPPAFLFLVGLGFLHLIALHFSVVISALTEKNKKLAQDLGIVREEVKRLKKGLQDRHNKIEEGRGTENKP